MMRFHFPLSLDEHVSLWSFANHHINNWWAYVTSYYAYYRINKLVLTDYFVSARLRFLSTEFTSIEDNSSRYKGSADDSSSSNSKGRGDEDHRHSNTEYMSIRRNTISVSGTEEIRDSFRLLTCQIIINSAGCKS